MAGKKFAVIVFPGSNCDHDCYHVLKHVFNQKTEYVWHKETSLAGYDCVMLPGGFSYGDYLRTGAIARFSPIMAEVEKFAKSGGPVLGICNGFQILCEAGLLPGVLMRNKNLKFICETVNIRPSGQKGAFTGTYAKDSVLSIPIAHADGSYFADAGTIKRLEDNGQIAFRYCDVAGNVTEEANPNGSLLNIAGITNEKGNVLGMMPHPERVCEKEIGGIDGRGIFESIINVLG